MNPFAVLNTAIPSSFLHEIAHPALSAALLGVAAPVVKQSWLAGLTALRPAAWNGLADGLLGWIVQALVLGTAAAVATWLMFVALRGRLRPGLQVAFWLVVLVRFVAPDGPQFSWSLASIVSLVTPSMTAAAKPATLAAPAIDDGEWEIIPITAPLLGSGAAPVRRAAPVSVWARVPWRLVLAGAYAAALSLIVARRSVRYARFVRAAGRLPEAAPEISAVVSAICQARGVKRMPCVRVSDAAPAPFVYGFLRPTLVLSGRMLSCPRELEAVVLHEIAHLRRGDLWARGLQCLAGTLLFFWPVVAWVNRRIDLAREHACDEWALRHGQLSPGEYARCLLRAAQGRGAKTVGYAPAAMAANLSHVERRIDMILNTSNPTRGGMLRFLAAGTLLAWSAFVLTGAASTKPLKDDAGKAVVSVKTGDDDVALWEAISDESADSADVQDLHRKILAHIHGALANSGVSNDVHTAILNAIQRVHADGTDNPAPSFLSTLPLINFIGSQQDGDLPGALAGNVLFVQQEMTTDGDGTPLRIAMVRGPGDAARAEFLANHPTADADGDGVLSAAEHNAYLIAQAMSAPAGVLAQYPSSDLNGDGLLSADEVAQLLVAGPMPEGLPGGMKFFRVGGDGSNDVQHTIAFRGAVKTGDADATQSSEQDVFVVKPDNADSNASFSIRLAPQIKADGAVELKVEGQPADVDHGRRTRVFLQSADRNERSTRPAVRVDRPEHRRDADR